MTGPAPPPPPSARRRTLRLALAGGVTGLLLAGVGSAVGWREIANVAAGIDPALALAAVGLVLVTRLAETAQMVWILRRSGIAIGGLRVLMAKSLGVLYGVVLPGDLVGGLAKWSSLAATTGRGPATFQGVVYNRAVLLGAEATIGLTALLVLPPWRSPVATAGAACFALVILAALTAAYHPRWGRGLDRRALALAGRWAPARARRWGRSVSAAADPFRAFSGREHLGFYLGGCAIVALRCTVLITWSRALAVDVPWLALVWVKALLSFLRQLPISFGGLGLRESALVVLLAPFGVPAEQAFALGLVAFTGTVVFALVGLVSQALVIAGIVRWRGAPPEPADPGTDGLEKA